MKLYGSLSRLVSILFRKNSQDLTLRPNQATTYTAARDTQLPPGDTDHVLVSATSTATLTNKTFDADGTGNSITNIENADIKAGAAIDAAKIHDGSVSNTEFGFLDGVTSSIQTQIDSKVTGPASATDEALARFDGTTGKLVQNSVITATDAGVLSGVTQLNVDNLRLDGNTVSSTDTNGNVIVDPDGSGEVRIGSNLDVRDAATLKLSDADSSAFIGHKSPTAVTTSVTYTWPEAPAANGYVLKSTTGGTLSWEASAISSFETNWTTADTATFQITHNLGTTDVQVEIYDVASGDTILIDAVTRDDANNITVSASEAPPGTDWRVIIHAT